MTKMFFSVSDTGDLGDTGRWKEIRVLQLRVDGVELLMTLWLLVLPLSYRRFVGAKATKLGSCDKHEKPGLLM